MKNKEKPPLFCPVHGLRENPVRTCEGIDCDAFFCGLGLTTEPCLPLPLPMRLIRAVRSWLPFLAFLLIMMAGLYEIVSLVIRRL